MLHRSQYMSEKGHGRFLLHSLCQDSIVISHLAFDDEAGDTQKGLPIAGGGENVEALGGFFRVAPSFGSSAFQGAAFDQQIQQLLSLYRHKAALSHDGFNKAS